MGIHRRTLAESQDYKESSIHNIKILDHTLGSQDLGTTVAILVEGTQIKDDLITEAHVLDHTLGSQHMGTTVAILVEGTQIKLDLIGSEHIEDGAIAYGTQIKADVIGSEHIEAAGISYADQIKDAIITAAKFNELQEHGTVAVVTKTGVYLTFDESFGGTPTIVVSPESNVAAGTFPYVDKKLSGSALIKLTGSGTVVCDYIAWGART